MSLWCTLRDSIRNGKGVIIIGPVGSGKTAVAKNLLNDAPYEEIIPVFIKTDIDKDSSHLNDLISKIDYPAVPILVVRTKEEISFASFVKDLEESVITDLCNKCCLDRGVLTNKFYVVACPGEFVSLFDFE